MPGATNWQTLAISMTRGVRRMASPCIALALTTCTDRGLAIDDGLGSGEDPTGAATEGLSATGPGSETDADGTSGGAVPVTCGDGVVDPGEACDDANAVDGDGCNRDCVVSGTELWRSEIASGSCGYYTPTIDATGMIYTRGAGGETLFAVDGASGAVEWAASDLMPDSSGPVAWRTQPGLVLWQIPGSPHLRFQARDQTGAITWDESLELGAPGNAEVTVGALDASDELRALVQLDTEEPDLWNASYVARVTRDGPEDTSVQSPGSDGAMLAATAAADGSLIVANTNAIDKYSADGVKAWTVVPPETEFADDVAAGPGGSIFVALTTSLPSKQVIRRLDEGGAAMGEWSHPAQPHPSTLSFGGRIEVDSSGNVVVASRIEAESSPAVVVLAKYTAGGEPRWEHTVTVTELPDKAVRLCGLAVGPDDTIVVGASWQVPDLGSDPPGERHAHYLIKWAP